jgi:apolipoprotein D and lipocalin family protein
MGPEDAGRPMMPPRDTGRGRPAVDLGRFVGDWYLIAGTTTQIEKDAHNAIERCALDEDGTLKSTFCFRRGSFDGEIQRHPPRALTLDNDASAVRGKRIVWSIRPDDQVLYVKEDYSQAIIAMNGRDVVRILARTPSIAHDDFFAHAQVIREQGFDTRKLRFVPQQWDALRTD